MSAPKKSAAQSHPSRWRVAIAIPVLLASGGLCAQVIDPPYVEYGPLATPIPTLSGWAFLLLAMFMLAAVWQMKRKDLYQGSKFLITSLVVGALASAASGVQLVSNANAISYSLIELVIPSGGRAQLIFPALNCVQNKTDISQQIIKIDRNTVNAGASSQITTQGSITNFGECSAIECTDTPPKTVLPPDAKCTIPLGVPT